MLPRIRSSFQRLAVWSLGLGLVAGACAPFLADGAAAALGAVPLAGAAGLLVGGLQFALARRIVGRPFDRLAVAMRFSSEKARHATAEGARRCRLRVESDDAAGACAAAFNHLLEGLGHSETVERTLGTFSEELCEHVELDALASVALARLLEITGTGAGAVAVAQNGRLELVAGVGLSGRAQDLGAWEPVKRVLQEGHAVAMQQTTDEDRIREFLEDAEAGRHVIVAPLVFKHVPLGVLVLASAAPASPDALELVELLRPSLAIAIRNAMSLHALARMAAIDPLTGLYNRRFGAKRLDEELKRALRDGTSVAVLLLDIDHFKSINDTYGHLAGDRVIIAVAAAMRRALRESDVVVRYGGEEFLVILPGAIREDARCVGERIRAAVAAVRVEEGDDVLTPTASLGGSAFPRDPVASGEELIRHADDALYTAKRGGRNRVVMARTAREKHEAATLRAPAA